MATARTLDNLLGMSQRTNITKSLIDLLGNYYNGINTRPIYQRNIRWSQHSMNDFIKTVMNNGFVPGLILYKIDEHERLLNNDNKRLEMVDGQHRIYTLKAFADATFKTLPHIKKPFIVQ